MKDEDTLILLALLVLGGGAVLASSKGSSVSDISTGDDRPGGYKPGGQRFVGSGPSGRRPMEIADEVMRNATYNDGPFVNNQGGPPRPPGPPPGIGSFRKTIYNPMAAFQQAPGKTTLTYKGKKYDVRQVTSDSYQLILMDGSTQWINKADKEIDFVEISSAGRTKAEYELGEIKKHLLAQADLSAELAKQAAAGETPKGGESREEELTRWNSALDDTFVSFTGLKEQVKKSLGEFDRKKTKEAPDWLRNIMEKQFREAAEFERVFNALLKDGYRLKSALASRIQLQNEIKGATAVVAHITSRLNIEQAAYEQGFLQPNTSAPITNNYSYTQRNLYKVNRPFDQDRTALNKPRNTNLADKTLGGPAGARRGRANDASRQRPGTTDVTYSDAKAPPDFNADKNRPIGGDKVQGLLDKYGPGAITNMQQGRNTVLKPNQSNAGSNLTGTQSSFDTSPAQMVSQQMNEGYKADVSSSSMVLRGSTRPNPPLGSTARGVDPPALNSNSAPVPSKKRKGRPDDDPVPTAAPHLDKKSRPAPVSRSQPPPAEFNSAAKKKDGEGKPIFVGDTKYMDLVNKHSLASLKSFAEVKKQLGSGDIDGGTKAFWQATLEFFEFLWLPDPDHIASNLKGEVIPMPKSREINSTRLDNHVFYTVKYNDKEVITRTGLTDIKVDEIKGSEEFKFVLSKAMQIENRISALNKQFIDERSKITFVLAQQRSKGL